MLSIDLSKRVALVLGGSRGIGAGITETLCAAGAAVVFTYWDRPEFQAAREALLQRLADQGGAVQAVSANACDAQQTAAVVRDVVARHGRIDYLVCVVGQTLQRDPAEITDDSWRQFIDLNLSAAFYGVRAVLPHMERAGFGRIIFIGSAVVYDGGGGAIDYVAGKAGLVGMTAYLTRNYARKGILTNTIHPCVVDTDLLRERYGDPEKRRQLIAQVPVGRLGTPADIANLAAYLVSPLGSFICGQSILVDGGRTLF